MGRRIFAKSAAVLSVKRYALAVLARRSVRGDLLSIWTKTAIPFMAEAESGEGWPRLMAWLRGKREEAQELVMSGQLSPEQYLGMSMRYKAFVETLDQAKVISRGEDVKPASPATAIMEQIEGA